MATDTKNTAVFASMSGPPKTSAHTVTALGGVLYVIGGRSSKGAGATGDEKITVWKYLPSSRTEQRRWQKIASSNTWPGQRWGHSVCAVDAKRLFMFGGFDHQCNYGDGWFFDIENERWTPANFKGDKVHYRAYHTAISIRNSVVLFGGCYCECGGYAHFNDVHVLNLDSMSWRKLKPRNPERAPSPRSQHAAVLLGKHLAVIGGYDGRTVFGDTHLFDMEKHEWMHLSVVGDVLPSAMGLHPRPFKIFPARREAVVRGSKIIVVGNIKRFEGERLQIHVLDLRSRRPAHTLSPKELKSRDSPHAGPIRMNQMAMSRNRRRNKSSSSSKSARTSPHCSPANNVAVARAKPQFTGNISHGKRRKKRRGSKSSSSHSKSRTPSQSPELSPIRASS
eukprot:jgi/Bigna1/126937/aug1.3_g1645